MSNYNATISDLVILSATTVSRTVESAKETADANLIGIISPPTLPETVIIEVSHNGVTFVPLQSAGVEVAAPAAGRAVVYNQIVFPFWRLFAVIAVAADRIFKVSKNYRATR